jgi:plastocyanin
MTTRFVVRALACAIALVPALSCFSDRVTDTGGPVTGECSIPANAFGRNRSVVVIRDFAFLSDTVRIRAGDTVTWVNCEPPSVEAHTSTSTTGIWNSNLLAPGASYARTFPNAGTFPYFCQPHPGMRGAVVVE